MCSAREARVVWKEKKLELQSAELCNDGDGTSRSRVIFALYVSIYSYNLNTVASQEYRTFYGSLLSNNSWETLNFPLC
jgi:hypothetical protein